MQQDRLLVATRRGLFTVDRARDGWRIVRRSLAGENVSAILDDPRVGTWLAAVERRAGCLLLGSTDAGETWHPLAAPMLPCAADGGPTRLVRLWVLEIADPSSPGALWCGTIPGALFRSDDGGRSWHIARSLWDDQRRHEWISAGGLPPGLHSVCANPRDPRGVVVGVSAGGVWATADAGATWECRGEGLWAAYLPPSRARDPHLQHAHRVVQCGEVPETLWCQHHNGVYRSTDRGRTWGEVGGEGAASMSGFAAAAHPRDPDTAWFAPTVHDALRVPVGGSVAVVRTRDGGRTFESLGKGLPQEHAYDIAWRHGLDVDDSGDRLALGSTTGSLWVSEDQGDTWAEVAAHLPPIQAVRFASRPFS